MDRSRRTDISANWASDGRLRPPRSPCQALVAELFELLLAVKAARILGHPELIWIVFIDPHAGTMAGDQRY